MELRDPPDEVSRPLRLVEGIRRLDGVAALAEFQGEVVVEVRRLLASGADVLDVTAAVAALNDALTRRLLRLAEAELGPPPCAYAWLALGSQGRGEQVLSSDQDSALAYDGAGDEATDLPGYFGRLAETVVRGLALAGLRECYGGYMATNWCRPLEELRSMFYAWVERPEPAALLQAEVFLDVRPVHGALSAEVLNRTLVTGGARGPFRVRMARAAVTFRPPLTLFGRVRAVDGALDVKRAGTAAVVLLARLAALTAGSAAHGTRERLAAGADGGTLSRAGAAALTDAYRFLTVLRLRHQVEQVQAGRPPDNAVRLDDLSAGERERLRSALRHVRDVQEATASRYATHTVT